MHLAGALAGGSQTGAHIPLGVHEVTEGVRGKKMLRFAVILILLHLKITLKLRMYSIAGKMP